MSTASLSPPYVVEDCRGAVQLLSDGTVRRSPDPIFPVPDADDGRVEWRDAQYDPFHDLHLRLYRPRVEEKERENKKLPVLFYFHGGGFCLGSRTWPNFHTCCLRLSLSLPAIILSVDYRLAPEHRLPAGIDDAAAALLWFQSQSQSDPWLAQSADLGRVFVSGDSGGGNFTHHMAVRFGSSGLAPPIRIRGFILLMPAFGGTIPTQSELETPPDAFLTREMTDRYCRLALPLGATKDHPIFNPFGPESPSLAAVEFGKVLVVVAEKDLLRDAGRNYAARLKEMGKKVELVEFDKEQHAFFVLDPWSESSNEVVRIVKRFVDEEV
ncbi:strigolactones hydrolase CXE15-like [Typha angustifolia]|uniref:strigolactones hydrolase CXE15-like n=1 Tax=Typha angustifolia TaxID=59011 RepID=UPI003C2F3BA0